MVTAEIIHKEIDSSPLRVVEELKSANERYSALYKELSPDKEDYIIHKGDRLKALGFTDTSEVIESAAKKVELEKMACERRMADYAAYDCTVRLTAYNHMCDRYPFETICSVEELDRICNQYGLVYAPVSTYTKTVPEKNLREMERAKPLNAYDSGGREYTLDVRVGTYLSDPSLTISEKYAMKWWRSRVYYEESEASNASRSIRYGNKWGYMNTIQDVRRGALSCKNILVKDKSGLFIAAPKSHFKLAGYGKDKFGFFKPKKIVDNDPIVFQFLIHGFVRIITKWGIEAENPTLIVPKLN